MFCTCWNLFHLKMYGHLLVKLSVYCYIYFCWNDRSYYAHGLSAIYPENIHDSVNTQFWLGRCFWEHYRDFPSLSDVVDAAASDAPAAPASSARFASQYRCNGSSKMYFPDNTPKTVPTIMFPPVMPVCLNLPPLHIFFVSDAIFINSLKCDADAMPHER